MCWPFKKKKKTKNINYKVINEDSYHVKSSVISNKNNNTTTYKAIRQNNQKIETRPTSLPGQMAFHNSPHEKRKLSNTLMTTTKIMEKPPNRSASFPISPGSAFDTEFRRSSAPKASLDVKIFSAGSSVSYIPPISTSTAEPTKPGQVYIFNNEKFDAKMKLATRIGTEQDEIALRDTLEFFNFDVKVIKNATVKKIENEVKKIEIKDYSKHTCILIVILSHGLRGEKVAAKDGTYSIDDQILFPMLHNPSLNGKPKIFFIQACKGSMEVGQVAHIDSAPRMQSPSETLKCYSTFEGFVCTRHEDGSVFIQTLCQRLKEFGATKDIKEIAEIVQRDVKNNSQSLQTPSITSSLTGKYFLGKKYEPQTSWLQ